MNKKPTPPEGYKAMLGRDVPNPIPAGTKFWYATNSIGDWFGVTSEDLVVNSCYHEDWYAIPILEESTPQKDPIGNDPKGEIGKTKSPMWLLPSTALIETAWAHQLGANRYGSFNWREHKVCASTYVSAIMRHLMAFQDGQDADVDSKRSHLAHIAANCNILMDAAACGTLVDDRPKMPMKPISPHQQSGS